MSDLAELEQRAQSELAAIDSEDALRAWNTRYFGDNGLLKQAMKKIGEIPKEERPAYGQKANQIKEALTAASEGKQKEVKEKSLAASLASAAVDVTLPGRTTPRGRLHLATQVMREICAVFADLGF